jgi:mono/diheme cytochrome c family protein
MRAVLLAVASLAVTLATAAPLAAKTDPDIAYGEYVAKSGDCAACHTAPDGGAYAGGLPIGSPVGTIYASNITPSQRYGIGLYTRDQFARALRKGIRRDGANLYPAMPYTAYANYSDRDVDALYAYFMKAVAPVEKAAPKTSLPFPANIRLSMAGWNLLFFNSKGFRPDPSKSAIWNRGKYLVEGAAHCSTCHTPRGFLMQERGSRAFAGAQVGAWYAPNITSDKVNGIGAWSKAELAAYLRTGVGKEHGARAAGTMAEAIQKSFRFMTQSDIDAIATFIQTVPAVKDSAGSGTRFNRGAAGTMVATTRGLPVNESGGDNRGAIVFQARCATCHGIAAQGSKDSYYPSLFHSSTTGANNANLVATILNGVDRTTDGGQAFMPGFGGKPSDMNQMSDADVALVANYVMQQYGGLEPSIDADYVATIRAGGQTSSLIHQIRIGMGLALAVGIGLALWLFRRRRSRHGPNLRPA